MKEYFHNQMNTLKQMMHYLEKDFPLDVQATERETKILETKMENDIKRLNQTITERHHYQNLTQHNFQDWMTTYLFGNIEMFGEVVIENTFSVINNVFKIVPFDAIFVMKPGDTPVRVAVDRAVPN